MHALVIQVTVWRDDTGLRARVWSDASGEATVHHAASDTEVLDIVRREIERWNAAHPDAAP